MTTDPITGPYFRGRLALCGIGSDTPLAKWLDSIYAVWLDAPAEVMEKAARTLEMRSAMIRPDRDTWGLTPVQQALSGNLQSGPGVEQAAGHGPPGSRLPSPIRRTVRAR
jgi:hypothetical protein